MPNQLSRRGFLATALCAAGAGLARGAMAQEGRPNILFLLTDDQRWDALGCMGTAVIKTPNIDQMAREGVLFNNSFATTPICMASRASILTGQYVRTHGIDDFSKPFTPEALAKTYPVVMREAGYYTGFIGKWGVGGEMPPDAFDSFEGFPGQGNYLFEQDGKTVHLTHHIGNQIETFLEKRDASKPFCLSVSFKAPHVQDGDPRQYIYDPELEPLYKDEVIPPPAMASDEAYESLPDFFPASENRIRWDIRFETPEHYQESVKGYFRLVTGVDNVVGRARAALERLGLSENTIIIYTSDHGVLNGDWGLAGKWLAYEQSIRTPLIVLDPRLGESRRGIRLDHMALNIDMAPTLLDYAGISAPPNMQGRSVRPVVEGSAREWRTEWFFEHLYAHGGKIPRSEGVRTEREKYVRYLDPDPPLEYAWDLRADPLETVNLFDDPAHAMEAEALRTRWQAWRDALETWTPEHGRWQDPG